MNFRDILAAIPDAVLWGKGSSGADLMATHAVGLSRALNLSANSAEPLRAQPI
ncbi:MAG: hypothetical protein QF412_06425 [Planctomycetota bacterium]|nr:hypothetical protein [Planctomycetota bacterium]